MVTAATVGAVHPTTLAEVQELVLDDVPASALTAAAIAAIDGFVDAGGALVWTAGPATAAAGSGALDRLLPLRSPPPPRLAVMLLIDRSGSIGAPGTGAVAAGPAEVAAAAALGPRDRSLDGHREAAVGHQRDHRARVGRRAGEAIDRAPDRGGRSRTTAPSPTGPNGSHSIGATSNASAPT